MRRTILWGVLAVAAFALGAAPQFEKVPAQAVEMLKAPRAKYKSVSSGLLFVNGHYVKPSYRVVRQGTAIFVNDIQITGQVVPWRSFLATQDGYVPPAPKPAPVVKKVEKKAEKSVDDLFDDAPAAPAPEEKPAEIRADDAGDDEKGVFTPNEKSAKLLKRIDDARADVRKRLRDGYVCFYGSRYTRVLVEPRVALRLLEILPDAMRDANSGADLAATLRARGFPFMGRVLCDDLVEHRADYLEIARRREAIKDDLKLGLGK